MAERQSLFTDVLMSSVHDIKNSLLLVQSGLDIAVQQADQRQPADVSDLGRMQYEVQRVNNMLVQLLALYRLDGQQLSAQTERVNVHELLVELQTQHLNSAQTANIDITVAGDELLEWQLDRNLIAGAAGTIINNALRYAKTAVALSATVESRVLVLRIDDDGAGFPNALMEQQVPATSVDFGTGNTGLGIYFARRIATLHEHAGQRGEISLSNPPDGGGRFEFRLPGYPVDSLASALLG